MSLARNSAICPGDMASRRPASIANSSLSSRAIASSFGCVSPTRWRACGRRRSSRTISPTWGAFPSRLIASSRARTACAMPRAVGCARATPVEHRSAPSESRATTETPTGSSRTPSPQWLRQSLPRLRRLSVGPALHQHGVAFSRNWQRNAVLVHALRLDDSRNRHLLSVPQSRHQHSIGAAMGHDAVGGEPCFLGLTLLLGLGHVSYPTPTEVLSP